MNEERSQDTFTVVPSQMVLPSSEMGKQSGEGDQKFGRVKFAMPVGHVNRDGGHKCTCCGHQEVSDA